MAESRSDKSDERHEMADTQDDETIALDAEVAKTFQNRYNVSMSAVCGGLPGKLGTGWETE